MHALWIGTATPITPHVTRDIADFNANAFSTCNESAEFCHICGTSHLQIMPGVSLIKLSNPTMYGLANAPCTRAKPLIPPFPSYRTTPDTNPGLRRGGLISFFRKQRAFLPA